MVVSMNSASVEIRDGLFRRLWKDDCGALIATEWMVVATVLVLGLIPGLIAIRQGALRGLVDFANATGSLDQSYSFSGQRLESNCHNWNHDQGTNGNRHFVGSKGNSGGWNGQQATDGHNRRDLAFTPGSQAVKPVRPPLQLEPVNPTPTAIPAGTPCAK
jgi:hypothetical protein